MKLEITPQPSEEERAAIEAALAEETGDSSSSWADALLPMHDDAPEP